MMSHYETPINAKPPAHIQSGVSLLESENSTGIKQNDFQRALRFIERLGRVADTNSRVKQSLSPER